MSDERHDRELDRPLRAALTTPEAGAGEACPDAEQLALYAARALGADEREALAPHLSRCARCQAVLAVLVTAPDVAAVDVAPSPLHDASRTIPGGRTTAPGGHGTASGRAWWRWVLPLPAAAMAAALYFAVRPAQPPAPSPTFEMAARDTAPAAEGTLPAEGESVARVPETAAPERAPADADRAPALPRRDASAPPREAAGRTPSPPEAGGKLASRADETAPVAKGEVPSAAAPRFRIDAAGRLWMRPGSANDATAGFEAAAAWQPVSLPVPATLSAGACEPAGARTCWVAGRDGLLFRTRNGGDWVRVSSPTTADIVAILVSAPGHVVLTTADGARHETRDSGVTWRPLQR